MDIKYLRAQAQLKTEGDDAGLVSAVFSTFDVPDLDGDIVKASAFQDGEEIAMTWAHNWDQLIGKGVVRVDSKQARFDGGFFMDTAMGLDKFKTVKAMGDLQEWSWGFRVMKAEPVTIDGVTFRVITDTKRFEVSPVLKGAGIGTYTQSIKSNQPFADQLDTTLAVVTSMVERAQSLADLRGEKGRRLSDRYRERLAKGLADLWDVGALLDALLKSQEPQAEPDLTDLFARISDTIATAEAVALEAQWQAS